MNKNTVIFDLDGTLANIDARRKLATKPNGKLDWDVFFDASNISLDVPNEPVVKMAQMFAENDFNIVIFSGRNDRSFHLDIDDVFLVVDDRDKVVKMWRDLGLNTFQVAPGNF